MPTIHYPTVAAVVAVFVLAAVLARAAHGVVHGILGRLDDVNRAAISRRSNQLLGALTLLAYGVAAAASISLALARLGVGEPTWDPQRIVRWLTTHGVNVIVIVVGAIILVRTADLAIEQLQFKLARRHSDSDLEWKRRATTLSGILTSLVSMSVAFIAILMLLRELSFDIVPILTGAGIVGLAIGFGAQNLVRDVISGFFLILEDQVRIGDHVRINGVAGTVEQINLRTIVLRDAEGAVQAFANGTVTALANLSKQYSYAIVDISVAYSENIDRVIGTIREVGSSMERDPAWTPMILAPLEVAGVESLEGGLARVRIKFRTPPLNQGAVGNELRRRLMTTLVARGIKPFAT